MLNAVLKKLRKAKGLTQAQLAEKLNLSQATIASWENGTRRPDLNYFPILADLFGVSTDELLGREEEPKDNEAHAPKTIEARIVSYGMDLLPAEERQKILTIFQTMYSNNHDIFKKQEGDDE